MVEIVAGKVTHIGPIAHRMRAADREECAAFGFTPKAALRRSWLASSWCVTALVDGQPEAMMGLEIRSAIEGSGAPWMLATDVAYQHGRDLLRLGPGMLARMADSTPRLTGVVGADNGAAVRMLRRWGFSVEGAQMIGGMAFSTFMREC